MKRPETAHCCLLCPHKAAISSETGRQASVVVDWSRLDGALNLFGGDPSLVVHENAVNQLQEGGQHRCNGPISTQHC